MDIMSLGRRSYITDYHRNPKKVVLQHIQDGRTLSSLAAKCGISKVTIFNRVRAYREECQNNDAVTSELQLTKEIRHLLKEKADLEKENLFLKKRRHSLRKKSSNNISFY